MNQQLQTILDVIQRNENLTAEEKDVLIKAVKKVENDLSISEFKLDRTEKVKRTTAILLEETIAELEQKRKAVEEQNRELEIESALERVRSVAMGMKQREDMLEVCKTIAQQLEQLKVKEIRNVQTAIFYEEKGVYTNYEFYAKHDKLFITDTEFRNHPVAEKFAQQMLKGPNEVFIHGFNGVEVRDWLKYQKTTNVFIDSYLESASSLTYYWYSLGPVAMGISTYTPLNEDEINLFKRFRNVFELAYRRYLDIEKAEAQAREARIEAALERVRSRTMGMQKSDELREVAVLLYRQFLSLGVTSVLNCGYVEVDEINNIQHGWMTKTDGTPSESFHLPLTGDPIFQNRYDGWKRKDAVFHQIVAADEMKRHIEFSRSAHQSKEVEELVVTKFPDPTFFYCGNFSNGYLHVITGILLNKDEEALLERFTRVFDQTYTRFLDLQKAEAQAREARIQLSLERVRARAMAMHQSDELSEVLSLLFDQFDVLGIYPSHATISLLDLEKNSFTFRMTGKAGRRTMAEQVISLNALNMWKDTVDQLKNDDSPQVYCNEYPKEVLPKLWQLCSEVINAIPEDARPYPEDFPDGMFEAVGLYRLSGAASYGTLSFCHNRKPTEEEKDIVGRFATEFGRLYQRFLDLQKAEAQAREAQIEAALEKVRSRSLAMHESNELHEVVNILFDRAKDLDILADSVSVIVWSEEPDVMEFWVAVPYQKYSSFHIPYYNKTAVARDFIEAKNGSGNFTKSYSGKEKNEQWNYLFEHSDLKNIPEERKKILLESEAYTVSVSFTNNTALQFLRYNAELYTENENEIFQRFANVFEQAYIRFLDLKKAEAQAREAKIEAALERVRSRTMAMQRSEELQDAASIMVQQIQTLGVPQFGSGFNIWDDDRKAATAWMSNVTTDNLPPPFKTSSAEDIFLHIHDAAQRSESLFVKEQAGEELKTHYKYMNSIPIFREYVEKASPEGLSIPDFQIMHCAFFSQGYLMFITYEPVPEAHDIFKRFAKVFEQTYTRFLDLQKAEAQAREAMIEAALEKVRSRTMGMQKSEELKEVIQLVYEQFIHLNIHIEHTGFIIDYKARDDMHIWLADQHLVPSEVTIPYFDSPPNNSIKEAKEKGQDFFTYLLTFEEKNKFYKDLFEFVPGVPEETLEYYFNCPGLAGSGVLLENIGLYIENFSGTPYTDEENNTLMRFGKVFQQTYTRFLDLQKAEVQAREAQIELSLERVRANAMAMQSSDELSDVLAVLFEQFDVLGIWPVDTHLDLFDFEKNIFIYRATGKKGARVIAEQIVDLNSRPEWQALAEKWKKSKPNSIDLSFYPKEVIRDLMDFFPDIWAAMPEDAIMDPEDFPDGMFDTLGYHKFGYLGFHHHRKATEDEKNVLIRFANEFERLYQRFLDLQKAEAQAREAKIEAALERTRTQSMIMQHSNELGDTLRVFHEQVQMLGINSAFSFLWLPDEEKDKHIFWAIWEEGKDELKVFKNKAINYPLDRNEPATKQCLIDWKGDEPVVSYAVPPEGVQNYFAAWQELIEGVETLTPEHFRNGLYYIEAFMKYGCFGAMMENDLNESEKKILGRFAIEFERTYTRFLDLQKAETQAREAQIEAALERVRSRSIGMHRSDEIADIVGKIFAELRQLNLVLNRVLIWTFNDSEKYITWWSANPEIESNAESYRIDYNDQPVFINYFQAWKQKKSIYLQTLSGDIKKSWEDHLFEHTEMSRLPMEVRKGMRAEGTIFTTSIISDYGLMMVGSFEPLSDENIDISQRFGRVFQQSYTRYLDVQKAEAQAREAQIEAALEKVRSKSMAMHHSENLHEVITIVTEQFQQLGFTFETSNFITNYTDTGWDMWVSTPGVSVPAQIYVPYIDIKFFNELNEAVRQGNDFFSIILSEEEKNKFFNYFFSSTDAKFIPEERKQYVLSTKSLAASAVLLNKVILDIVNYNGTPYTDEENAILKRFGHVFEQSYIRFLDLQKAEGQAKEARIEAALEKVRSRTMAMHRSDELAEAAAVLFQQFHELGAAPERMNIGIVKEEGKVIEFWSTEQGGKQIGQLFKGNIEEPTTLAKAYSAWKEQKRSVVIDLTGDELKQWIHYLRDVVRMPINEELVKGRRVHTAACFKQGMILMTTPEPLPDETVNLLERFAAVFNLTYRRFLDLQKAEAQAREAQIEGSLERIRARSMSMRSSVELLDVIKAIAEQLTLLNLKFDNVSFGTNVHDANFKFWLSAAGQPQPILIEVPYLDNPAPNRVKEAQKNGVKFFADVLTEDENKKWTQHLIDHSDVKFYSDKVKQYILNAVGYARSTFILNNINLYIGNYLATPYTKEENHVFNRFAQAFEQSYTRFLDLQKAEAQARESQIEASLERVRSKTMAMHNSNDVGETVATMFAEFVHLGIHTNRCGILIFRDETFSEVWTAKANPEGKSSLVIGGLNLTMHRLLSSLYKVWKAGDTFYQDHLIGDDLVKYYQSINDQKDYPIKFDLKTLPLKEFFTDFFFPEGTVFAFTNEPIAEEHAKIFKRFAAVFGQTYRRYLDLQKAEAQAREATIEAALERVRARTMAMQHSSELPEAANLLFLQVQALGIPAWSCGYNIQAEDKKSSTCIMSSEGILQQPFKLSLTGESSFNEWHDFLQSGETFFVQELGGKAIQEHYDYMKSFPELKDTFQHIQDSGLSLPTYQINHLVKYTYGFLLFITYEQVPDAHDIFKRFTKVFEQTYTRFLDLQKAEASTKEAIKQAALDRIRADIASMRTIKDLDRITPLIWTELTILDIPFIRCGVFIMDEQQQLVHTFLSTPDGKAIAAFHLPYDTPGNIGQVVSSWKDNKNYIDHWDDEEFNRFADILVEQGALDSAEKYLKTIPQGGFYLHFLPFLQGMLYVGNTTQLSEEEISLIQSVADAFSTAYARYEDFNKLEAAKQQVDKTLVDLKQAQTQLVQSEKMASLGELTAGIAHEIQNPLNFVNNFSEVSKELLDEMKAELDSGNLEDAKEIMNDVIQNLEKINHHGKRADGIVKGMLQHSRSSSATKEPTDINALCDEYLRLSYHGLRAKDKSFNATMKTDFDESLEKINIVPQDIGRVILNLLTNAFYVVNEKKKQHAEGYEPTVSVSTKKVNNKVEIRVADNGNGIPQKVLDKIFQPFFTTKPTGQGTGLGLSLSYDIIKAHGGEIKVETKEFEGTTFIIVL